MIKFSQSWPILALCGLILTSCTYLDTARDKSAGAVFRVAEGECALGEKIRTQNFCAINRAAAEQGSVIRVTPINCDGIDGPDNLVCEPE